MTITRAVAAALGVGLVAGCAPTDGPGAAPSSAAPSSAAPSITPVTDQPTACATPPFAATTGLDTEQATGSVLGLKGATSGPQSCYDRVVFTLAGKAAGEPGWRVEYVSTPTSDGSGNPVAVNGPAYLRVLLTNVGYPGDTGVPEPSVRRFTPSGTAKVREVVLDGVYEGQYTAFIGVSAKLPFRVFRLADPARVVVDVRHS